MGEATSTFALILDQTRADTKYGTLKWKCTTCGAQRPFLTDENDQGQGVESPMSEDIAEVNAKSKPMEEKDAVSEKSSGFENSMSEKKRMPEKELKKKKKTVSGSGEMEKEEPQQAASSTWHVGDENKTSATKQLEANAESDETISNQKTLNLKHEEASDHHQVGTEVKSDSKQSSLYSAVEKMWLKSLADNSKVPDACQHCSDPDKQQSYFNEGGFVTHVLCTECGARTNWSVGDGKTTPKTLVTDLKMLQPGDHVAWHRPCAIWHHAIVFDTKPKRAKIEVVQYNGSVVRYHGAFASVRREWLDVDVEEKNFYRIDYLPEEKFPADVVMSRALQRLDEAEYNPFKNNCEHFARWCKTGQNRCVQIERIPQRMLKAADKAVTTVSKQQWCKNAVAKLPVDAVGNAGQHVAGAGLYVAEKTDKLSAALVNKLSLLEGKAQT
jgi:hypothetical protein